MKRLLVLIVLLCVSCSIPVVPTATPLVPTQVIPTDTPQPTPTALPPTATQAPTATQPPTATPLPPVINAQNAADLVKLGEMNSPSLRKVVFSPDGKLFATAAGNEADFGINIWQSQDGALQQSITAFSGIVWDLAFSPDGKWIASAADDKNGQPLRIWNAADGSQVAALDEPQTVFHDRHVASSVAFSPDGTRLAAGWPDGIIRIYDPASWTQVQELKAPGQNVTAVVFNLDGSQLISGGTDGHIRVWALAQGTGLNLMSPARQANRLALSPDGRLLASNFCSANNAGGCVKGGVAIWRTADWTILQQFDDIAESVAFSADGSLLISGSGANDPQIRIRRVGDWSTVKTLPARTYSVALSPDATLLVSTDYDQISMWGLPRR